ncbi:MAG TPA: hypothetical protein VM264_00520 [Acidimicrobiales bacterium]|nr:hypothetical protein [Acidimicrobiales bacterium]
MSVVVVQTGVTVPAPLAVRPVGGSRTPLAHVLAAVGDRGEGRREGQGRPAG